MIITDTTLEQIEAESIKNYRAVQSPNTSLKTVQSETLNVY